MAHEVLVVGGGIGGLTVAALLAARGVDVCLFERQPQVGGCVASVEKFGYSFEPTLGLYSGWGPDEIHNRIFAELPVEPPETRLSSPAYVARLADGTEITVSASAERFEQDLQTTFPECAAEAIRFYRETAAVGDLLLQALKRVPDFRTASGTRRIYAFLPRLQSAARLVKLKDRKIIQQLSGTSERFQSFLELQLRYFADTPFAEWSYLAACIALNQLRQNLFAFRGGAAALAQRLADSIKRSGGSIRLDSPVLRLSYDAQGRASGADLLSGENVTARRAIISNMTVWDTYGKLIGLQRTPPDLKKRLAALRSSGAYLIFAGLDEGVAERLSADHFLVATGLLSQPESLIESAGFAFAAAPGWDSRSPDGKRAVTIAFRADVDQWFTYQADQTEHEAKDQAALEVGWGLVHKHIPELGGAIEVIETATPQTYYELTRRKLGMIGGLGQSLEVFGPEAVTHLTTLPNVFMVGDTTFPGTGLAAVSSSALIVANQITSKKII